MSNTLEVCVCILVYVEADVDRCNILRFNLADMATSATTQVTTNRGIATLAARTWDMTVITERNGYLM